MSSIMKNHFKFFMAVWGMILVFTLAGGNVFSNSKNQYRTNFQLRIKKVDSLHLGLYRAEITGFNGIKIPFQIEISKKKELIIRNADERLKTNDLVYKNDSIFITLPFFDAEFHLDIHDGNIIKGFWIRNLPGRIKKYNLELIRTEFPRFPSDVPPKGNITGLWDMTTEGRKNENIGEFYQDVNGRVVGSILSVSGDDRYLEGRVRGDSLYLSTFDGAHCYLYVSKINFISKKLVGGKFYASDNPPSSFEAAFNPNAKLKDVYSLTRLKPGFDTLSFSFKNENGEFIHYPNAETRNKITILQFLGSWCPNCMDETAFLKDFYEKHKEGIAIIGLAYERSKDWNISQASVLKMTNRFNLPYPVLITGFTNQPDEVLKSIPELENYMAFPTMMVIDKKGKVRKIHTGFSGPGTGKYYADFVKEFNDLYQELILEK